MEEKVNEQFLHVTRKAKYLMVKDEKAIRNEKTIKAMLCGNRYVGQTSFLLRAARNEFSFLNGNLGIEFQIKRFNIWGHLVVNQIWDSTAGITFGIIEMTSKFGGGGGGGCYTKN